MNGIDYAGASPGAAAVKAAGFGFVARYLSRYSSKVITQSEYDDMTSNNVGVVLVFEDYANQALQGYAQGVSDAQVALQQANAIGWPDNRPIHFAVDFDISDAQKPTAGQYMSGVISVLGLSRVGTYGGFYWIKYCVENNLASFFWQAVAWSGGQVHPSATLFQQLGGTTVNGTSCDINQALKDDFGQNNVAGVEDMIPDEDNYFARWSKTFQEIRGRTPSRQEFQESAVGRSWLSALEILEDNPEADAAQQAQTVGQTAIASNWESQIGDLQGQVETLTSQNASLQSQVSDLSSKLNTQSTSSNDSSTSNIGTTIKTKQSWFTRLLMWFIK